MRKDLGKSNLLPLEIKVKAMPDQENQVPSVEWAKSPVWAKAVQMAKPKNAISHNFLESSNFAYM